MTLYQHQKDAIDFALANGGKLMAWHDPGLGKTCTTLNIFSHLRSNNPDLRMLVVAPLSLLNAAWKCDAEKFTTFKCSPYSELDTVSDALKQDIIVINFESLISEKRFDQIKRLMTIGDWMLVCDESSRLKCYKSVTTKKLLALAPYARHRVALSGTPAPNGEYELWAQAMFVDPTCFNKSFFAFRNTYFHLGRGNQIMANQGRIMTRGMMAQIFKQGFKYQITPANREALLARMKPFTHRVRKEDALDLPEKIDEVRLVRLNPNERKAYNEMRIHLVAEIKTGRIVNGEKEVEQVTAEVALTKLQKLRQITSGFLYTESHDVVRPGKSSKMRELKDVLEESVGDRQAIIWIQFKEEVAAISELLTEKGISFSTLYSGTNDKDQSIKDFQDGRTQILISHGLSAAHGLTFVNSNISIYFSLSYSWEQYAQSRDRQHRIGQSNKVTYIHLLAENTIDTMIMDVLNKKKSLQEMIYQLMKEEA